MRRLLDAADRVLPYTLSAQIDYEAAAVLPCTVYEQDDSVRRASKQHIPRAGAQTEGEDGRSTSDPHNSLLLAGATNGAPWRRPIAP